MFIFTSWWKYSLLTFGQKTEVIIYLLIDGVAVHAFKLGITNKYCRTLYAYYTQFLHQPAGLCLDYIFCGYHLCINSLWIHCFISFFCRNLANYLLILYIKTHFFQICVHVMFSLFIILFLHMHLMSVHFMHISFFFTFYFSHLCISVA